MLIILVIYLCPLAAAQDVLPWLGRRLDLSSSRSSPARTVAVRPWAARVRHLALYISDYPFGKVSSAVQLRRNLPATSRYAALEGARLLLGRLPELSRQSQDETHPWSPIARAAEERRQSAGSDLPPAAAACARGGRSPEWDGGTDGSITAWHWRSLRLMDPGHAPGPGGLP
jgi:hypothetical protein